MTKPGVQSAWSPASETPLPGHVPSPLFKHHCRSSVSGRYLLLSYLNNVGNTSTMVGENFVLTCLKWLKLHLNHPPWMEKIL